MLDLLSVRKCSGANEIAETPCGPRLCVTETRPTGEGDANVIGGGWLELEGDAALGQGRLTEAGSTLPQPKFHGVGIAVRFSQNEVAEASW